MPRTERAQNDMTDVLSESARKALADVLDPGERIDQIAHAVGCAVVLTDRRLLIVRDGASHRPKTGVRSFGLDHDLAVRIGPARRRILIEWKGRRTSAFIRSEHLGPAELLVAEARRRIVLA